MTKANKTFFQIWGLRILSLIIAVIIALVFYVRFYQSFLGDWQSAAWAALAVSIGSVIVTGYAISAFKLDMTSKKNRVIFATLWIFTIGLFLFDRATETYTMQSKKVEKETKDTNSKIDAVDNLPILKERLKAVQDANRKLADIAVMDSLAAADGKRWRYVTLRREAQRERRLADSLYHLERSQQLARINTESHEIKTAGIESNGLGFIVKNWPSAALGLVILGLLVAAYWKETEIPVAGANSSANSGTTTALAPDFILPPRGEMSEHEYQMMIVDMYKRKEFPSYVNQQYLAGRLWPDRRPKVASVKFLRLARKLSETRKVSVVSRKMELETVN